MEDPTMPAQFTLLLSTIWDQIDEMVNTIIASAVLLIPVGFLFVRKVIGTGKQLMGVGGGRRR